MYAATVSVYPPPGATQAAKNEFWRGLHQQAEGHPVEHIHLRDGPDLLQVTLFARTATQNEADLLGLRICAQTIRRLPGWQVDT